MKTIWLAVVLCLCLLLSFQDENVRAVEISNDQISINNIPLKKILDGAETGKETEFGNSAVADMKYYSDDQSFIVILNGISVDQDRMIAEKDLLRDLEVTKNEACFLDIEVVAPAQQYGDQQAMSGPLTFCSSPTQQDLNDDSEVNGVDFGQCIADYETSDEAESAFDKLTKREAFTLSTGQTLESLNELDLPCDFNVNRRIDALDLSKVLEAIKSPTSPSK